MTEKKTAAQKKAADALLAERRPHPTDGMTPEERKAYYERRRLERWGEAREIEARVLGLDWGPDTGGWPPYGNGMPWQGQGWFGSRPFYARLRFNRAALTIYEKEPARWDSLPEIEIASAVIYPFREPADENQYVGELHGADEIVELFERLIPKLAPVSDENPSYRMIFATRLDAALRQLGVKS